MMNSTNDYNSKTDNFMISRDSQMALKQIKCALEDAQQKTGRHLASVFFEGETIGFKGYLSCRTIQDTKDRISSILFDICTCERISEIAILHYTKCGVFDLLLKSRIDESTNISTELIDFISDIVIESKYGI